MVGLSVQMATHEAVSEVINSKQLLVLRVTKNSSTFNVPVGSLPCSHQSAIGLCPEPYNSTPRFQPHIFKINFNIILLPTPIQSKRSPPFMFPAQNSMHTSHLFLPSYMSA